MFLYNDIELDNVLLTFTSRDDDIEFYIEGFNEDTKISIDFIIRVNFDYLKTMELDYEYDLRDLIIEEETYLGIDNKFGKTSISGSIMKDLDEKYYLRVVNDTIDASVNFELEEKEEEEEYV